MIHEDDLEEAKLAQREPDQRFRFIEQLASKRLDTSRDSEGSYLYDDYDYMSSVLVAAEVFGINDLMHWSMPGRNSNWQPTCRDFRAEANRVSQRILFEYAARPVLDSNTVALDAVTKQKLRFHLGQLRGIVDSEPIADWKKQGLYDAISELEREIDKARTPIGSLIDVIGKAFEGDLKIVEALRQIVVIFNDAKAVEKEAAKLSGPLQKRLEPVKTKQLPPPKGQRNGDGFGRPFDDDIPF